VDLKAGAETKPLKAGAETKAEADLREESKSDTTSRAESAAEGGADPGGAKGGGLDTVGLDDDGASYSGLSEPRLTKYILRSDIMYKRKPSSC